MQSSKFPRPPFGSDRVTVRSRSMSALVQEVVHSLALGPAGERIASQLEVLTECCASEHGSSFGQVFDVTGYSSRPGVDDLAKIQMALTVLEFRPHLAAYLEYILEPSCERNGLASLPITYGDVSRTVFLSHQSLPRPRSGSKTWRLSILSAEEMKREMSERSLMFLGFRPADSVPSLPPPVR